MTPQNTLSLIKNLLRAGKSEEALATAEELLLAFPDNVEVFRLREKAMSAWRATRLTVVKKTLKETAPLWKSHNYSALKKIYEELDRYLPDCPLIQREFLRLNQAIHSAETVERKDYVAKSLSLAVFHEKKREFLKALMVLKEAGEVDPSNSSIFRAVSRNKRKYVDHNLEGVVAPLLINGEYEDALHLATNLLKVTPEYPKLHRMIRKCERLIIHKRLEEKKAYIETSFAKIRELFHAKKYERCLEACREVLSLAPSSFRAKYWTARALFADRRMETDDLYDQMTSAWKRMSDAIRASVRKRGSVAGMNGWRRI